MSVPANDEARLLTAAELEDVQATRYPHILELSRAELLATIHRLRELRDRAQAIARRQRREIRGKAEPRGATPARDNLGTVAKAQVLAQALKRANKEIRRHDAPEEEQAAQAPTMQTPTQAELSRKALALKQASRIAQHPSAGRTASRGMRSTPSQTRTVQSDPREVGRVSQAVKVAQAKRDN